MLGTINIKVKNVNVTGYFPPPLSLEDPLINGGTGVLSITFFTIDPLPAAPNAPGTQLVAQEPAPSSAPLRPIARRGIRYTLQVGGGKRINPLRLGQIVTVSAVDEENKPIPLASHLETVGTGETAMFSGPGMGITPLEPGRPER